MFRGQRLLEGYGNHHIKEMISRSNSRHDFISKFSLFLETQLLDYGTQDFSIQLVDSDQTSLVVPLDRDGQTSSDSSL